MKYYNQLIIILLSITLVKCGGVSEDLFSINDAKLKPQYTTKDKVKIDILNITNEEIDSVSFSINEKQIGSSKDINKIYIPLNESKLGYHYIYTKTFHDNLFELDSTRIEIVSDVTPKEIKYTIVNTYPHEINSYTQGLEFYNGSLYESTGQYGKSTLRKLNYKLGTTDLKIDLDSKYFGEGLTVLNDKIYQLTWQENVAFVYDAKTLKKEKELSYYKKMEGWGITNDGTNLYMSDSTDEIHILNPTNFTQINSFFVYSLGTRIEAINEMEWVDGLIYANVYQKNAIVVINPKTGSVVGYINFTELLDKITKLPETDVLNGIAYNTETKTFFVTGKNWDKMFEIKIK